VLIWSGIEPFDRFTWFLEVLPAILGLAAVVVTWNRFRFTPLVYALICLHCLVLMVGGKYTYAENPLFNWLRDHYGLARNYYDRLGHFMQGFVPALVVREVFLRREIVKPNWGDFLAWSVCMGLSAFYEFIEWWVALLTGESATAFLGTQGDVWDTQWDMFLCSAGAVAALTLLRGVHDRSMRGYH